MPTEQEVLEHLNEHGIPKDYRDNLRDQFEELQKNSKDWRSKAELYEKDQRRPLIEKALEEAQVDVSKLRDERPGDLEILLNKFSEGEIDQEALSSHVAQYKLPTTSSETPRKQRPAAADIAAQAQGGGAPASAGDKDAAFFADLDAVPDGDKAAIQAVIEKHGRLPAQS